MFASGYWRALTAVSPIMRRQFSMRRVLTRTYVYARNIHSRLSISDESNAPGRRLITFHTGTNDVFGEGSDQFVHAAFRARYRYLELVIFSSRYRRKKKGETSRLSRDAKIVLTASIKYNCTLKLLWYPRWTGFVEPHMQNDGIDR